MNVEYERFEELRDLLLKVLSKVDRLEERVNALGKRVECLGNACCTGFYQTRDAATCLREELSEASGTLIENSYII